MTSTTPSEDLCKRMILWRTARLMPGAAGQASLEASASEGSDADGDCVQALDSGMVDSNVSKDSEAVRLSLLRLPQ